MMELFLSLASSIIGIITSFTALKSENKKVRGILITAIVMFFCILIGTIMVIRENNVLKSPQTKIDAYLTQWEGKNVDFISNGEMKGAMIEGMLILESIKDTYPEGYAKVAEMVYEGHDPRKYEDFWKERDRIKGGFEAVRTIIKGLKILQD